MFDYFYSFLWHVTYVTEVNLPIGKAPNEEKVSQYNFGKPVFAGTGV